MDGELFLPAECGPCPQVILSVRDGRLMVDTPRGVLTPEWRAALAAQKALLLAAMAGRAGAARAPWEGQRVRIEDLPPFKAHWGLRVAGGDPDLDGEPWTPKVYLVEG
jgi:hypothetical protein